MPFDAFSTSGKIVDPVVVIPETLSKNASTKVKSNDEICVIESVKAASDIYAPIDGEVVEINNNLSDDASLVNQDPENDGWIFKMKIPNSDQFNSLMTLDDYLSSLEN